MTANIGILGLVLIFCGASSTPGWLIGAGLALTLPAPVLHHFAPLLNALP